MENQQNNQANFLALQNQIEVLTNQLAQLQQQQQQQQQQLQQQQAVQQQQQQVGAQRAIAADNGWMIRTGDLHLYKTPQELLKQYSSNIRIFNPETELAKRHVYMALNFLDTDLGAKCHPIDVPELVGCTWMQYYNHCMAAMNDDKATHVARELFYRRKQDKDEHVRTFVRQMQELFEATGIDDEMVLIRQTTKGLYGPRLRNGMLNHVLAMDSRDTPLTWKNYQDHMERVYSNLLMMGDIAGNEPGCVWDIRGKHRQEKSLNKGGNGQNRAVPMEIGALTSMDGGNEETGKDFGIEPSKQNPPHQLDSEEYSSSDDDDEEDYFLEETKDKKTLNCYFCGVSGHLKTECRFRKNGFPSMRKFRYVMTRDNPHSDINLTDEEWFKLYKEQAKKKCGGTVRNGNNNGRRNFLQRKKPTGKVQQVNQEEDEENHFLY